MKALLILITSLLAVALAAQTDGLTYQALIIDQDAQEVPGYDVSGLPLVNTELTLQFSILEENGTLIFQEQQQASTDSFGMINAVIGTGELSGGSPLAFDEIDWDGLPKDLLVEFSLDETVFDELSQQALYFVPYAFHRNITATGTLTVDQSTLLNGSLTVANASPTSLTGALQVEGESTLEGATAIESTLTVEGTTTLEEELFANGQVTIDASLSGNQNSIDAYPLIVKGSKHGIAIQTNTNALNNEENFITFFNDNGNAVGRIEGQDASDVTSEPEYIFNTVILSSDIAVAAAALVGATTSSTACVGVVPCITVPIPSLAVAAGVSTAAAAANLAAYQIFAFENLGVTYESGSADYAEWLERDDLAEKMSYGDIVAVYGGKITKRSTEAERYMVISHRPAVLGNMPATEHRDRYEMVAFMGQVPVKVKGDVAVGDYIIPSGKGDGFGIAVSPDKLQLQQVHHIVGTAWSEQSDILFGYVNVAIGMDNQSLAQHVRAQDRRISDLEHALADIHKALGISQEAPSTHAQSPSTTATDNQASEELDYRMLTAEELVGPAIQTEDIEASIDILRDGLEARGIDTQKHPVYGKIFYEEAYRNMMIEEIQLNYTLERERAIAVNRANGY